ncbi:glycosyltransferase [Actinokineospora auranticolor]|uniref:MGT family glycosyltransferase n=1 Tax=Actinokineospora auranticolor TaxID=155976 RepID=A0A2S6GTB8_9PSEU|nr:macrolide family glycosyltransferase [Actinokineospora auranticolor]PPK68498.1 MGT family glycosyltransferase [Actinokineospora auranticolor]
MPSGRIAIVAVTSPSHIYPWLALVDELAARGHRVSVSAGESVRGLFDRVVAERSTVEFVAHPSLLPDPATGASGIGAIPVDAGEVMQVFLREAMIQLPRLTAHFDTPPDLVLCDPGAMAGQVLARRHGVPAVTLAIMPMVWSEPDTEPDAEVLAGLGSADSAARYYELADAWLADNGITGGAHALQGQPDGTLSLVPRAMQPGAERAPESVRFVGPCLARERLDDRSWTPPADGRRVVLVSLGNSFNDRPDFYRTCVEAFADTDWHVVLVAGKHAATLDAPAHVRVYERVPQLIVLEHASAFVTHAGMGGCVEALWYGVPMVAIPQGVDQFGNAARVAELGVGTHLPAAEVTADALRQAVDQVSADPVVAERLAAARAELRAGGGVSEAANTVESYLTATVSR